MSGPWVNDGNAALLTDLYELTMLQAYVAEGLEAPATFDLDDDEGKAFVVDPAGDPEDKVRLAAEGCPTRAISLN